MAEITPAKRTWRVFKRNKIAVGGLAFILLTLLVAILGYLIMPDDTPLANNMVIQLSIKKPGSTYMMLKLRKAEAVDTVNLFSRMLYGQPSFYKEVPVTGYHFVKDSIYVNGYIGDEDRPEKKAYNIFEVMTGQKPVYKNGKVIFNYNGQTIAQPAIPAVYQKFEARCGNRSKF